MSWFAKLKLWWEQRNCSHWNRATRTWFDDGAVHREAVCLLCGKRVPCPPISNDAIMDLLEQARKAAHGQT